MHLPLVFRVPTTMNSRLESRKALIKGNGSGLPPKAPSRRRSEPEQLKRSSGGFSMLTFKVGDKAVYPAHGVGVVQGIESTEISGRKQTFYILRMLEKNDITIKVPVDNAKKRLRKVIPTAEVQKVFE